MTRTADLHQQAMALADLALIESMKSNNSSALDLYNQAFALERDAAIEARTSGAGEPTISVLHRSAATLALDAGQVREAERLVAAALALDPPDALADELRDLLEQVHFRRHLSLRNLELNPGEFQFSLKGQPLASVWSRAMSLWRAFRPSRSSCIGLPNVSSKNPSATAADASS